MTTSCDRAPTETLFISSVKDKLELRNVLKVSKIEHKNLVGVQRLLVMPSKLWKFECSGRGTFGLDEASFWDVSIEWSSGLV